MEYTVSELAKLSGVSGRTLRYYDEIGLLKPARINDSGYRIYGEHEVDFLQQILFYRELGISLTEILHIITNPTFDHIATLKNHLVNLEKKRTQLDKLISTVEKTIAYKEGGINMQNKEKFTGFKEKIIHKNEAKYGAEIRTQFGDDTVDGSNAKLRGMSQTEYDNMINIEKKIIELLIEACGTNNPMSDVAKKLVMKHKKWLMYSWTTYSKEAHAGLAGMYVADERFAAYYDKYVEGGAEFLRDAIIAYVKEN